MLLNRKHNRVLRWRTACDTMSCHIAATCALFTVLLTDQSIVAADKMRCRHEQLIRQTIKTDYSQSSNCPTAHLICDSYSLLAFGGRINILLQYCCMCKVIIVRNSFYAGPHQT